MRDFTASEKLVSSLLPMSTCGLYRQDELDSFESRFLAKWNKGRNNDGLFIILSGHIHIRDHCLEHDGLRDQDQGEI